MGARRTSSRNRPLISSSRTHPTAASSHHIRARSNLAPGSARRTRRTVASSKTKATASNQATAASRDRANRPTNTNRRAGRINTHRRHPGAHPASTGSSRAATARTPAKARAATNTRPHHRLNRGSNSSMGSTARHPSRGTSTIPRRRRRRTRCTRRRPGRVLGDRAVPVRTRARGAMDSSRTGRRGSRSRVVMGSKAVGMGSRAVGMVGVMRRMEASRRKTGGEGVQHEEALRSSR